MSLHLCNRAKCSDSFNTIENKGNVEGVLSGGLSQFKFVSTRAHNFSTFLTLSSKLNDLFKYSQQYYWYNKMLNEC